MVYHSLVINNPMEYAFVISVPARNSNVRIELTIATHLGGNVIGGHEALHRFRERMPFPRTFGHLRLDLRSIAGALEWIAVVDKDWRADCGATGSSTLASAGFGYDVEVVVIVAGHGEVPHPPVMIDRDRTTDDDRDLPVGRLQIRARFKLICRNELVQIRRVD
jgi:hypothetical protein